MNTGVTPDARTALIPTPPRRSAVRAQRCDELARRGTGVGACDLPLDEHGYCERPSEHLDVS